MSDSLTLFFRKSYELSSLLYKVLDDHITFDCSAEQDIALLVSGNLIILFVINFGGKKKVRGRECVEPPFQ